MGRAYLSLGSNVEPHRYLRAALEELRARFGELTVSPAYRSVAVGFDGPDFVNLAVGINSDLAPEALNDWLHALEDRHGRVRGGPRFSDRTLDVDIVLYDDLVLTGDGHLEIPRGELRHAFVLRPMADIAPQLRHPVSGATMAELWSAFPSASEPMQEESLDH
ncbi:2-amino-4-hydroxy-6-hydroxymethyldihydropteridine diphosphokinase [Luteibacter sp. Sphag1AF]|uniref:2-amino-4-hydroxy-6- hydroxymethyldihydropteridine diphosphokinase n=1 Tax=Luteibacter sp. Sphag1AF TaxID=2587031 RepID=UPI00160E9603|nr:2-amino-4-hydroxy-6-hydroxymethyldihydropteridine diphosphokinase [Luteibacter sp. Sphag1AF]MBB3226235.1 2-amino-4-hydroxy-6-hydroxymethyldihydropteridine diphosphokinase [Luteibacter sp. Sphag1AF]